MYLIIAKGKPNNLFLNFFKKNFKNYFLQLLSYNDSETKMNFTINCDMGEGFGLYSFGVDLDLMPFVTHVNIACGFHASDPPLMWKTVKQALKHNLKIGAHPGFPDKEGFGRRKMVFDRHEITSLVLYQSGALKAFLEAEGKKLDHLKPHGALMGMAQESEDVAQGIADAAEILQVPVISFYKSIFSDVLKNRKIPFSCEFYADLDYDDNGKQIISKFHKKVDLEFTFKNIKSALETNKALSINGKEIDVLAQSICIHSDTPNALEIAKMINSNFKDRIIFDLV